MSILLQKKIVIPESVLRPNYFGYDMPGVDKAKSAVEFRRMCLEAITEKYSGAEISVSADVHTITVTLASGEVTDRWCYNFLMYEAIRYIQNFGSWVVLIDKEEEAVVAS